MNVCFSGGAKGADQAWGEEALKNGHNLIHYSFKNHSVKHSRWKCELTQEQLNVADEFVKRANKTLKRSFPTKSEFVNNLLRRNFYQIMNTEALYAVGTLEEGRVAGGTAWAVQMYIDRCDDVFNPPVIYFFDQKTKLWHMRMGDAWVLIDYPPIPSGNWTGIGSRDLTDDGLQAIKDVFIA